MQEHTEVWRAGSLQNYNMTRVKGLERRPFIFIFKLNIVLHNTYQVDEILMEYKKVQANMSKALAEFY